MRRSAKSHKNRCVVLTQYMVSTIYCHLDLYEQALLFMGELGFLKPTPLPGCACRIHRTISHHTSCPVLLPCCKLHFLINNKRYKTVMFYLINGYNSWWATKFQMERGTEDQVRHITDSIDRSTVFDNCHHMQWSSAVDCMKSLMLLM